MDQAGLLRGIEFAANAAAGHGAGPRPRRHARARCPQALSVLTGNLDRKLSFALRAKTTKARRLQGFR